MESGGSAKKVDALEAELAKSSRIADLEARVSFLEAENASLRKVLLLREGEAMHHTCESGPTIGRLKGAFGGNKQKPIDMSGEHVVDDVTDVSDGDEEGMAVDLNKGESAEVGVSAVPTPVKCAMLVSTGQSDDEVEIMDGGGGNHGSVCCDARVDLKDEDVSIVPGGKHRATARVISDNESGNSAAADDGGHENEEVCVTSSRKRGLRYVSDSGSEDVGQGVESEDDDGELYEMEGRSTPATRRSARLAKSQSKRIRPTRRALEFVEPKDHEESEDDSEEDDSMDEFIDDADCTEIFSDSAEEYSAELEESDNEETYKDVMANIRGKKNAKNEEWEYEAEMLSAFAEQPELCLKAVCAIYRKQTEEEKTQRSTIVHNKKGFSQIDAPRGSRIAQFLLDGDTFGPLKKTTQDLENYERSGPKFCHRMALRYSKQLFKIYKKKEDPYFP